MPELLHFTPRSERNAKTNLANFVRACRRQSNVFGLNLDFDADAWDVTDHIGSKGTRSAMRLHFWQWSKRRISGADAMAEPFKSFAKAYVRYQQGLRPSKSLEGRLIALRALHESLREGGQDMDPTGLLPLHFNRAAQLIRDRVKETSAYQYGVQLELVYQTMAECGLLALPQTWRSPIPRTEDCSKVGKQFDEKRMSRLPSPAALGTLAAIFQVAKKPSDVLVTATVAIMCAAPVRINEVLGLPERCEVEFPSPSLDYGLRWHPSKGAAPQVKLMVRSMSAVVRLAISRLKQLSSPARDIARWYEANPKRMYLPDDLEHFRAKEMLNMEELTTILFEGLPRRTVARLWCSTYEVPTMLIRGRSHVQFQDVEAAVLRMLPRGFPFFHPAQGLRFSEALFILRKNEMHGVRATYRCLPCKVGQEDIYNRISGRYETHDSIFSAFGYREPDGSEISVRTHQFRHYLNTLAQLGGMSQMDIAVWSGRARVSENKAYDHVSNQDVLQMMREVVAEPPQSNHPVVKLSSHALVRREEFARLKVRTAHTTDFGYCAHDFSMLPCMAHQDCLNCDEHFCKKGEMGKEQQLKTLIDETRALLLQAENGRNAGLAGSERWVAHQRKTLERAEGMLRILQDPSVHQGAVIKLNPSSMPSRLVQAVQERQQLLGMPVPRVQGRSKREAKT